MIELKIHKYITENNNEIAKQILFDTLDKKQKILLISPMKTGKTTFIMKYLSNILRESKIQLIFVTPVKSLMNDIKNKYPKVIKCNGSVKEITLNNDIPILTTPESMHKVITACEEENKDFFIVYDEIHQVVINANFREKLKNPLLYYSNKLCIGLLGMTATAEPLENIDFDKRFKLAAEEKFIQANETKIIKDFTKNIDNMLNFIKYMKKLNNDKLVIARINNKDDIKLIKGKLDNSIAWYRSKDENKESNDYINNMESLEDALSGQDLRGIDYILCTSLIDVGVEIQLEEKPIVIDFLDINSTIIDDIQFVGRFRQGIEQLYLVGKLNNLEPNTKPLNFKKEYNKQLEETKDFIKASNKIKDRIIGDITKDVIGLKNILNENNEIIYEVDEYSLMQSTFKQYINFYLQTDVYLKLFLEKHPTFNSDEIVSLSYDSLEITKSDELKQEKEKIKNDIKDREKEFLKEVKLLNLDDKLLKLILNYNLIENKDLWKIKDYEYLCNTWKHDNLEEYRKRYDGVLDVLKGTKIKQIDILKIALTQKGVNELIKKKRYINSNIYYNENRKLTAKNKEMLIVYKIRDYINKTKEKERGVYLTNKFKSELLECLKKEKSLSKLTAISLDKHLKNIYSTTQNNRKQNIISSIKLEI